MSPWPVLLFIAAVFVVAVLLGSRSTGGKHRAPRRHRPSGDLLADRSRDDELDGWPPQRTPLGPTLRDEWEADMFEPYEGKVYTAADLPTVTWDPRLPQPPVGGGA